MAKYLGFLLAILVIPGYFAVIPAAAQEPKKVDICHVDENGIYRLIRISENAVPAHLAHGDAGIGQPVPGMSGYVFGEGCTPVLSLSIASGCYSAPATPPLYPADILYTGPLDTVGNMTVQLSTDGSCAGPLVLPGLVYTLVAADSYAEALAKCESFGHGTPLAVLSLNAKGYVGPAPSTQPIPAFAWNCLLPV